jgi:hypothetical protein
MRKFAVGLPVCVLLMSLLGGCNTSGVHEVRFVSQSDSRKVIKMTFPNTGVLVRLHNSVFTGGQPKGTYTLTDGDKTVEGRAKQDNAGFLLYTDAGEKQRLAFTSDGIKDQDGALWKPATEPVALPKN